MTAPLLVFGYGNPSRGDDALGPQLLELLAANQERHPEWPEIELLTDFQLQIEDAADMENRDLVLFIDASASCPAPFSLSRIQSSQDVSHTTHAMSPATVLQVFERVYRRPAPPAFLLAVRGESFELGEPLGREAEQNRDAALDLLIQLCARPYPDVWQTFSR
ncbi:hydrogenase maturation protease [Sulfuricella sp.]|uniref:hydrogenase maturation protease n=1 Tax=Sulfuricella sp. TaxID=2099377 RepID=UPI002CCC594C|nr:hydrogenase maturation protease [Sulfuricella sp.]HUX62849.1 hydrogenase maturation protease [Sulfuricella sp.]